jgi:hypothetical protein
MQITRPAGRSLTVGELREALATCPDNTPVNVLLGDEEGEVAPVLRVASTRFLAEIVVDSVDPTDALDLLYAIAQGEYTLKNAKVEAKIVLRAAGIEVSA